MARQVGGGLGGLHLRRDLGGGRNMARQEDAEGRALADFGIDEDDASGLLDDAVNHRQSEARAFPDFLGGKKGLEDLFLQLRRNAGAGVGDLEQDIFGRRQQRFLERGAFGRRDIARAERDLAALRHRVARIDHEIDHDLLELVEVSLHQPEIASVLEFETDLLAGEAPHQHLQVGQQVVDLQHLRPQGLPARERQQLPHETRRAIGVLLDLHDVLEGRIGGPVIVQQQIGIADDRSEHIVEVMRHAAGQLADRLHLLRLREILLQRALLGRVERVEHHAARFARVLGRREEQARRGPAFDADVERRGIRLPRERRLDRATHGGGVPIGQAREDGARAVRRLQRRRHELGESRVGALDLPLRVEHGDSHRRRVEEARETRFGGADILGRVLAGRTIEHERPRLAGLAVPRKGDAMDEPDRQPLAAAPLEVDVDLFRAHLARPAGDHFEQRRAGPCHELRQLHPAGADLREIVVEPAGERGVHECDHAALVGGEEAGGGVIQEIDDVLELLKDILVPLALARDVGDRPQGGALGAEPVERPHPDTVPADAGLPRQRRREPHFLDGAAVFTGGLSQAIDGFRDFRRA